MICLVNIQYACERHNNIMWKTGTCRIVWYVGGPLKELRRHSRKCGLDMYVNVKVHIM